MGRLKQISHPTHFHSTTSNYTKLFPYYTQYRKNMPMTFRVYPYYIPNACVYIYIYVRVPIVSLLAIKHDDGTYVSPCAFTPLTQGNHFVRDPGVNLTNIHG